MVALWGLPPVGRWLDCSCTSCAEPQPKQLSALCGDELGLALPVLQNWNMQQPSRYSDPLRHHPASRTALALYQPTGNLNHLHQVCLVNEVGYFTPEQFSHSLTAVAALAGAEACGLVPIPISELCRNQGSVYYPPFVLRFRLHWPFGV